MRPCVGALSVATCAVLPTTVPMASTVSLNGCFVMTMVVALTVGCVSCARSSASFLHPAARTNVVITSAVILSEAKDLLLLNSVMAGEGRLQVEEQARAARQSL